MTADSTCWTVIRAAAGGDASAREQFARRYLPVVRAYLDARWRAPFLRARVDDAVQEAFVECYRRGGVLDRVDPSRPGGFRPFLMGVLRNVARRVEERFQHERARTALGTDLDQVESDEDSLAVVVDRAWALQIVHEAGERQRAAAAGTGAQAERRVELLRLRFREGLPIREIATRWDTDAAMLHREYAKGRREFLAALEATVADHHAGSAEEIRAECERVLDVLR